MKTSSVQGAQRFFEPAMLAAIDLDQPGECQPKCRFWGGGLRVCSYRLLSNASRHCYESLGNVASQSGPLFRGNLNNASFPQLLVRYPRNENLRLLFYDRRSGKMPLPGR